MSEIQKEMILMPIPRTPADPAKIYKGGIGKKANSEIEKMRQTKETTLKK